MYPWRNLLIRGEKLYYGRHKPTPEPDWVQGKGTGDNLG